MSSYSSASSNCYSIRPSSSKKLTVGFHPSFEHQYSPKPVHRMKSSSDFLCAESLDDKSLMEHVHDEDSGCESSTSTSSSNSSSSIASIPIKRSSFDSTVSSYYRKISRNELKHIESRINVENHKREQQQQMNRKIRF